ncbi:MAG: DUF1811 family protein [Bacillaceae bacterium]|nr:DUF1811 family protein [Bacillaceae bacterium]
MASKRYSEMSEEELLSEMDKLAREAEEAQKNGNHTLLPILEQKYYMARSYYTDPKTIRENETYQVEGYEESFTVEYLNGVMAWGRFPSSTELTAIPIGRLIPPPVCSRRQ